MGAINSVAATDADALPLEIGIATRPFGGATVSGDHHTICAFPGGVLIAVVDGLGHGKEAAVASHRAVATINASPNQSLSRLFQQCNDALKSTRGAVMTMATIDIATRTMSWAAIGNVDAALFCFGANGQRKRQSIVMIGGVIGSRIAAVRPATYKIERGDTLVFATDGIRADFGDRVTQTLAPQALANDILAHCGKTSDDALVLVARWLGGAHS